jgi:hypothetical protein
VIESQSGEQVQIPKPGAGPDPNAGALSGFDGSFWFETGERTREGRNLARDSRCVFSVATHDFDLVVEGTATQVTDPGTVAAMAARWAEEGWPVEVDETGRALTAEYSAPSAGAPPWLVYRLSAHTATALSTIAPGDATHWRF